jgi:hypothetical protein
LPFESLSQRRANGAVVLVEPLSEGFVDPVVTSKIVGLLQLSGQPAVIEKKNGLVFDLHAVFPLH